MTLRRRPAERRAIPRFDVVGELWGTLETAQALPIVNIGTGGALILSEKPWEVGSLRSIVFANLNEIGHADVRVRHIAPAVGPARGYAVGVQFVSVSPGLAAEIARWTGAPADPVPPDKQVPEK
ncbi:MAG TPA: PilZ domain-containing protein [Vicinamibacterales bacterium]|nr:PilZ domain-containing protein [Vicinamibacterales bacterium]